MSQNGRGTAPFERVSCERLTEQILTFSSATSAVAPPHEATPQPDTLSGTLRGIAITIRKDASWFADPELAELMGVALGAAAASSASLDLYSGVTLIETVGTFSALPPESLLAVARFLAHTYYNATRANKTRKLADATWAVTKQVLESHLGAQFVAALPQVIGKDDYNALDTKTGYAAFAGAVMIISEKLLLRKAADSDLPKPQTTDLLDCLRNAALNGNIHVRELIMDILIVLLAHDDATANLALEMSWHSLLATTQSCVEYTSNSKSASALVDSIVSRLDPLDSAEHHTIASLCIAVARPLEPVLQEALLSRFAKLLPVRDWANGFDDMIRRLSRSDQYLQELQMLLSRSLADFTSGPDQYLLAEYAGNLEAILMTEDTTEDAAAVLTKELIRAFTHCSMSGSSTTELSGLFGGLCEVAKKCIDATKFMLLLRADTEGAIYYTAHNLTYNLAGVLLQSFYNAVLSIIVNRHDWDIYYHLITELPAVLGNHALFDDRSDFIQQLRETVCHQLESGDYKEPPPDSALTKSHVTAHLIEILTAILSYHNHLRKQEMLSVMSIILSTAGSRDYIASIPCIHALTICCYELPDTVSSYMGDIIDKMSKMVTQRYLAIHVLLFLAGLSRLPDLFHNNFRTQDYKKVFGVCGSYLQSIRGLDGRIDLRPTSDDKSTKSSNADSADALPQYVYALTHHVIAFWYVALKPEQREEQKDYITSCLRHTNADGKTVLEDQGLVTIDLMDRIDADQMYGREQDTEFSFDSQAGRIWLQHRVSGLFLITTETSLKTRETIVTARRPTGTSKRLVNSNARGATFSALSVNEDYLPVWPDDSRGTAYGLIYLPSGSELGPAAAKAKTLPIADEAVTRAIQSLDRTPAVDSHKAGVIYIGEGQHSEAEILLNVQGSPDYITFISNLGTLRPLKDATFNTQGLDRSTDSADGTHAIVWNNEITELVYHITTLMPNNGDVNLNTTNKKRHIGNDFVNIIFNNSGAAFSFDTFPSQFNAVYIVITPSARTSFLQTRRRQHDDQQQAPVAFYRVQVLVRPNYPAISSAATEKIVSAGSLAGYVRNLALNDCVFSVMWDGLEREGGEYPSSWRSRLEQIRKLKGRFE